MQVKLLINGSFLKKSEVIGLIDNYHQRSPIGHVGGFNYVSAKNKKFGLVKHFYYLSSIGALKTPIRSADEEKFCKFYGTMECYQQSRQIDKETVQMLY